MVVGNGGGFFFEIDHTILLNESFAKCVNFFRVGNGMWLLHRLFEIIDTFIRESKVIHRPVDRMIIEGGKPMQRATVSASQAMPRVVH